MGIAETDKAINNKIEQNKSQYDLNRHTAKNSALSSGSIGKYELWTDKDVLHEKKLLDKATIMKRFEYFPLGKKLKA